MNTLRNLTQTRLLMGNKNMVQTHQAQLGRILDEGHLAVVTGAYSSEQVIRRGLETLAAQGVGACTYPSGHVDTLETVVRRAMVTGINQTAIDISLHNALQAQVASLTAQVATAQDGLKAFGEHKPEDFAAAQLQIAQLQQQMKDQADGYAFDTALDGAIRDARGRDVKAIRGMLDLDRLKGSKDRGADIQAALKALAAASKAFSAAASAHWLAQTRCPIPLATAQRVNIPLTQVRSQTEEAMALLLREKQLLGLAAVNASRGTMPMGLRFRVNTELREVSKSYLGAKLQADIYLRGNLLLGQTASSCAPIPMATAQRVNIPLTQIRAVSSGASLLVLPEPVRPEVAGQGRSYTPLDLGVRQRKNAVLAWQTKSFTAAHLRQTAAQALQPAAAKAGSDSIAEMRRCWRKAIVLPGKADSHGKQLLENAVPRSAQMRRLSEENSYDRSVMVRIPSLDTAASGNEWARWCAVLSDACAQGGEASAQEKAESINAASLKLAPMQTPEAAVQIRARACMGVETEQRLPFGLTGKIQGQDAAWLLLVPNLLAGIATQLQSCESVVMQLKEPCVPTADGQGQTTARHSLHAAPKQTVDIATHIVTAQLASLQSKPKLKAQATAVAVDQARCEVKSLPGELMHARCTASSKAAGRLTRHPALYGEAAAVAHSGGSAEAVTFLGRLLSVSEISQSREGHTLYAGGGSALGAASAEKTGYIAQLKAAAREQLPEGCAVSAAKTACRAALELWQNTPPDTDWASQSGTVLTIQRTYYNRMDEDTPGQLLIDSAWYAEPALQAGTLAITSEGYNDYGLEGQNENKL